MKTITLKQVATKTPIKLLVHNIKLFYPLTYKTGTIVSVVEFMDGDTKHFEESSVKIENLIND